MDSPPEWEGPSHGSPASPEADAPWPGILAGVPRAGSDGAGPRLTAEGSLTPLEAAAIAALLRHCFDDGRVHARGRDDRRLLRKAVQCGLVDTAGYPTRAGRRLLDVHSTAT